MVKLPSKSFHLLDSLDKECLRSTERKQVEGNVAFVLLCEFVCAAMDIIPIFYF